MINIDKDYIVVNTIAKRVTELSRILIWDVIHMNYLICLTFYNFNINLKNVLYYKNDVLIVICKL
jgi:hypothetical protein